jgi:hypothetical protein
MTLSSQLSGQAEVIRELEQLERRASDLTPAWREMLADWKAQQKRVFDSEGASIGRRWAPLSPKYAAEKARHGGGGRTLVLSGSLREAAEGRGGGFVQRIAPLLLHFEITHPTARYQHARRPITHFSENDRRRWLGMLEGYLRRLVRGR